VKAEKMSSA